MTDKQIIIDGCDVSGCVKLRPYNECGCQPNYGGSYGLCSEWKNCYYKQLKRKEQELEQYKKSKQASYEQLQKRCNELELGIRKLQKQFGIEILYCKATGESTFRSTEILKLKQTLTEIKEYLRPYLFRGGVEPQWVEWQMAQREKEKMAKDISKILQKYNEVLDV